MNSAKRIGLTGTRITVALALVLATVVTTSATHVHATSHPDLEMAPAVVSEDNLSPGSRFTLATYVTNEGHGDSEGSTLHFYRSTDSTITSSDTTLASVAFSGLAAEGNAVAGFSVALVAPTEVGTYYYGACVDSVSGETDTDDNCSASASVIVNNPATGTPTISGTAQVGQTLTASTSGIADTDGLVNVSYSYQWLADDTDIDGATSSTYTPQTSDNGKVIKVRVTFTDDKGSSESLTSEGTAAVVTGGI